MKRNNIILNDKDKKKPKGLVFFKRKETKIYYDNL